MKRKILTILLVFICLFTCGCSSEGKNDVLYRECSGDFTLYMTMRDSFYYPVIAGYVVLSDIPDKLGAECAGEEFELEIKSINRTNELYIMHFKQEHVFASLGKETYAVNLIVTIDGIEFEIKNFDTFTVSDEYDCMYVVNSQTLEVFIAMDKVSNWIGPF